MTPRPYQAEAIEKCVMHFWRKCQQHAVCVLPTGAGKSIVIAKIVEQVGGNFLILQPSKEILEQNIAKYRALGKEATVYSAILGQKDRSQVTFATIGSVMGNPRAFAQYRQVIVDECHVVNPKAGQYQFLLNGIPGLVCVGLTATPYRLRAGAAHVIEFVTRTRPAFWQQVIHVTQQRELLDAGYLSPLEYKRRGEIDLSNVRVRGLEYEDASLMQEMTRVGIDDLILQEIEICERERRSILVFVEFVEILRKINRKRPDLPFVTGNTPQAERAEILNNFRTGKIQTVLNVGVLTTGFDHPELDAIIVAKATKSLSLWYQIVGRGQRIAPGKNKCHVVDMCGNLNVLGDPQKLEVKQIDEKWTVTIGNRIITNKAL